MNKDILNYNKDKDGKYHGKQISYYSNGNISWIGNYHHAKLNGYRALFNTDNSINYKGYYNMGKWIYDEYHDNNQIQIKI